MYESKPDPASADYFDSQTLPTVNTSAAGTAAVPGDGGIIGVWFALAGAPVITAVQTVEIQSKQAPAGRTVAAISTAVPSIYLKLCDYGSVIQQGLNVVNPTVVQPVACGYIRRTFKPVQGDVDKTTSGGPSAGDS